MERLETNITTGLTNNEIHEKIVAGLVNGEVGVKTKSYQQILRDNLLSLFNLINVILLVCILISGSYKNALFFLVVIWNFIIGVFQEIRAKKTIEKLSLISSPTATVVREGKERIIPAKDIVLGEIMRLDAGSQVCCDCVVLKGNCRVNESLVTGESDTILKEEGDPLLSGSFLTQGMVVAKAQHVGKENYVNQITTQAGSIEKNGSVIMRSVKSIVRVIAICILPVAGLFIWNNFFRLEQDFSSAMVKTVAAVSSMIPGGLVLLVSVVLAVSVVRLSRHNTLVQDLYSVEHLARVDTLLLDKTGTITDGKLAVEKIVLLTEILLDDSESSNDESSASTLRNRTVLPLIQFYADHSTDQNATMEAIRAYKGFSQDIQIEHNKEDSSAICIPFSSDKKWGMVYSKSIGSLVLGAPDVILPQTGKQYSSGNHFEQDDIEQDGVNFAEQAKQYAESGKRVILFAISEEQPILEFSDHSDAELPGALSPLALIIIDENIREEAPQTFAYFEEEGVTIKVISGDNPLTVSRIAQEAGVRNALDWVDASQLDEDALKKAVSHYTVFGRVKPDQKLKIVQALQEEGHTVAMTGDGANDVLALRAADCGVAMQSGSDAARYAANIVLLDSNFTSMPLIVAEGRKSINNLQRSASLYLTKTVYAFIFAIFFIVATAVSYPFENIQVTLFGAVTIGIPSFFLALEPNKERISGNFLWSVFRNAVPAGVLEAVALIATSSVLKTVYGASAAQISTASTYLMMIMGILIIIKVGGRPKLWKCFMILLLAGICFAAALIAPALFSLVALNRSIWKCIFFVSAAFAVIYAVVELILFHMIKRQK